MNWLAFWLFGLSGFVLFYSYCGFTILLFVVSKWLNRRHHKENITPKVSLLIAAYNEEAGIGDKLENVMSLDYPQEALEVIVASDGSTDATNEIVTRYANKGIQLLELPRRGKMVALNEAVKRATGEVLVFSDANTHFLPQALRMLVRNFADPSVGGVCGNQNHSLLDEGDNSGKGEHLYWSYDKWLKEMESLTGSIVSADGAIYAIRRSLYKMPPRTDVTDDFAISTAIVAQGYRLIYESKALVQETVSSSAKNEFQRKVRIINRGLRGVILRRSLLNPFKYGFYSVILFSHKVLRRLVPVFLILLFVSSLSLSSVNLFFLGATVAQILFYGLAFAGYFLRKNKFGELKLFYIPFFYCLANAAALIAITKLMRGTRIELWQPKRDSIQIENVKQIKEMHV